MKFFDVFDAPPIKKPSISGNFLNCAIFELSTDPPYKTGNLFLKTTGSEIAFLGDGGSDYMVRGIQNGATEIYHNAVKKLETTSSGVTVAGSISDDKGDVRKIIMKTNGANNYNLIASDVGKAIHSSADVVVPNSVFSAGDAVTLINSAGSNMAVQQGSGLTMYNSADGATGNRTLSGKGMATVYFVSSSTCYITGSGLT